MMESIAPIGELYAFKIRKRDSKRMIKKKKKKAWYFWDRIDPRGEEIEQKFLPIKIDIKSTDSAEQVRKNIAHALVKNLKRKIVRMK